MGTRRQTVIDARQWIMPAEWAPHAATWLAWPRNPHDWPAKLEVIPWVFAEMARKIAHGEQVAVLVNSAAEAAAARRCLDQAGVRLSRIAWHRIPTDRAWVRDFGPIFVRRRGGQGGVGIVRFGFNAWAKYPDWARDAAVPEAIARALGRPCVAARRQDRLVILEGGSIDVNGRGRLLTTEECLLDARVQTRNPGFTRADYARVFRDFLGVREVIWLGRGIAGDTDTHGHVDDVCRFVGPRTVVLPQEPNPKDYNHRVLEENRERLEGTGLEIVRLPMPAPLYFAGRRLPASYANFYIANAAVLTPTFNDPNDRVALGILSELFPSRPVVGIHAVELVLGLGAIHCLTQQQPQA